jgi:hypothetical protein
MEVGKGFVKQTGRFCTWIAVNNERCILHKLSLLPRTDFKMTEIRAEV